jgi:hypothetical protein
MRFLLRCLIVLSCLLSTACHKKGTAEHPSLPEARELSFPQQQSFVRLGRELRSLKCVRTLDWSHPTAECVNQVQGCSNRVSATLTEEMINLPEDKFPHLRTDARLAVYLKEDLDLMQMVFGTPLAYRPNNVENKLTMAARKASDISDVLDEIFGLDDPGWTLGDAPPPPPPPPKRPEAPAPAPAAPKETPPAAPAPTTVASDAGTAIPPAPVVPAAPVAVSTLKLTRQLKEMLRKLDEAGHDAGHITDLIINMRTLQEQLDADLKSYREVERTPESRETATKFADQVARARNKLSKALGTVAAASKRSMALTNEAGESPFGEADLILEQARTEVALAEDLGRAAP